MKQEFDTRYQEGMRRMKIIMKEKGLIETKDGIVKMTEIKTQPKKKNKSHYQKVSISSCNGIKFFAAAHRISVENFLGRILTKKQSVHHLDGNKANNNINNLMLFPNFREHKKFEKRVKKEGMTDEIKEIIDKRWEKWLK